MVLKIVDKMVLLWFVFNCNSSFGLGIVDFGYYLKITLNGPVGIGFLEVNFGGS